MLNKNDLVGKTWSELSAEIQDGLMDTSHVWDEKSNDGLSILDFECGLSVSCKKIEMQDEDVWHVEDDSTLYDPTA